MSNVRQRKRSKENHEEASTPEIRQPNSMKHKIKQFIGIFLLGFIGHFVRNAIFPQNEPLSEESDNLITPLKAPSAVKSLGTGEDMERYWGSYRSGYYLGMKTRAPKSPIAGLMWFQQYVDFRQVHGDFLRHKCNQDNQLRYGWKAHDGIYFGEQTIEEKEFEISTKFVKRPRLGNHGGDWTWKIDATSTSNSQKPKSVTFMVYFAVEEKNGELFPSFAENKLSEISGNSAGLGEFTVKFEQASSELETGHFIENLESFTKIHENSLHRLRRQMVQKGQYNLAHYFFGDTETKNPSSEQFPNQMIAYVVTGELPLTLEVIYESKSADPERPNRLSGENFIAEFNLRINNFRRLFSANFNLGSKWSAEHVKFAEAAVSNAVGGMAYFHGHSWVQRGNEPVQNSWETPLFTGVPSRSFFPRGFLWDEGFHQLLISKFNPTLSIDAICHWLDLLNQDGWIPREQILDDEARSRVPDEFIVQRNNRANPPTLFLALDQLIDSGSLKLGELESIYPRLVAWFNWFNDSQAGPVDSTYAWQGRDINDFELNPKSLSSGLDDYPRATHPTKDEYHLDLRCWMALATQVLGKISLKLGKSNVKYLELETKLKDFELLNKLHWDEKHKIYADYGHHSEKVQLKKIKYRNDQNQVQTRMIREVLQRPKDQFVNHRTGSGVLGVTKTSGYVTLFPLIIKIVDPDSEQLGHMLDLIRDEERLWTPYGLRSLSKTDAAYNARNTEHDPPYWRGQIWININFLVVRALEHYSNEPGPHAERAGEIYVELRSNIVSNVFEQYQKTGFIWENYNQDTGVGQGCHPFTGWSALTVLMMKE